MDMDLNRKMIVPNVPETVRMENCIVGSDGDLIYCENMQLSNFENIFYSGPLRSNLSTEDQEIIAETLGIEGSIESHFQIDSASVIYPVKLTPGFIFQSLSFSSPVTFTGWDHHEFKVTQTDNFVIREGIQVIKLSMGF
jgi:hypothetical protein